MGNSPGQGSRFEIKLCHLNGALPLHGNEVFVSVMTRFSGSYAVMPEIAPVLSHLSSGPDSWLEGTLDDCMDANYSVRK